MRGASRDALTGNCWRS